MDTAKIVSHMMQTYAWLHPNLVQDIRTLRWEMSERTWSDVAKSPYSEKALLLTKDGPTFFYIPIEIVSSEVLEYAKVNLVIEVA